MSIAGAILLKSISSLGRQVLVGPQVRRDHGKRLGFCLAVDLDNVVMAVTPTDARVLGRAYDKQVDVVIARWDRGPELLVSTKTPVSSSGKNLANRFEETYGDAGNLRGRCPLAAVGVYVRTRSKPSLGTSPMHSNGRDQAPR